MSNKLRLWLFLMVVVPQVSIATPSYPSESLISQVEVSPPEMRIHLNLNIKQIQTYKIEVKLKDQDQVLVVKDSKPFKESGRGIAYTLLLDVSGSMKGEPFEKLRDLAEKLPDKMLHEDKMAVITFGEEVRVVNNFTNVDEAFKTRMTKLKDSIQPTHPETHLYSAIKRAFAMNQQQNPDLPGRRVIIVITDGKDEGSGIVLDDLARQMDKISAPPIYAIGYTNKENKTYLRNLERLAELSNGRFTESRNPKEIINSILENIQDIQEQVVIRAIIPNNIKGTHIVQVNISEENTLIFSGEKEIFFPETIKPGNSGDPPESDIWTKVLSFALFLALLAILWQQWYKKDKHNNNLEEIEKPDQDIQPVIVEETESIVEFIDERNDETMKGRQFIQLIVLNTQEPNKKRALGKRIFLPIGKKGITIGSGNTDIMLNDPKIGNIHCLIEQFGEKLILRNFSPEMMTFLNGIPIPNKDLVENGDVIMMGDSKIRIVVGTL